MYIDDGHLATAVATTRPAGMDVAIPDTDPGPPQKSQFLPGHKVQKTPCRSDWALPHPATKRASRLPLEYYLPKKPKLTTYIQEQARDRTTVITHQAVFHRPGHTDHLVDADLAVFKRRRAQPSPVTPCRFAGGLELVGWITAACTVMDNAGAHAKTHIETTSR